MIHCGTETSAEACILYSHHTLLRSRHFWPSMANDARKFVRNCDVCQNVNLATLKVDPELVSVNVPQEVFKQIGVDISSLPEMYDYKYIVVANDYFSKWSEARALRDKSVLFFARFLCDNIICRHSCSIIHITDQGREFVKELIVELFRLTGTQQRVTTA